MELASIRPRRSVTDRSKTETSRNAMNDSPTRPGGTPPTASREVIRLYPPPARAKPLRGLYLNERLPEPPPTASALVYANFVTSLDGRIAVADASGISRLPEGLTNPRDWRLFQELQAHADCLMTHGGYLRALASRRLGNVLQVGLGAGSDDIARWRAAREMTVQPAVAVLSASLDLPVPESLEAHGQPVHVLTTDAAPPDRRAALLEAGLDLVVTGPGPWVRSRDAIEALAERGYRRLYLQTGPRMLESALRDGVLSRLYLTIRHRIVGGERFDTMVRGDVLGGAGSLRLNALYLDQAAGGDCGQLFACFDTA